MAAFTDKKKRSWGVALNASTLAKIRELHDVDLLNMSTDPLAKLRVNPGKLVAVVYSICERQIQRLGLSPEEFASCLPLRFEILLKAIEQAIPAMFPTARQAGIRQELAIYRKAALKSDQVLAVKLSQLHPDQIGPHRTDDEIMASVEKLLLKDMEQ